MRGQIKNYVKADGLSVAKYILKTIEFYEDRGVVESYEIRKRSKRPFFMCFVISAYNPLTPYR